MLAPESLMNSLRNHECSHEDMTWAALTVCVCVCRCAVDAVQHAAPHVRVVIYAREGVTAAQLVQDASNRFNVKLRGPIEVRSCASLKQLNGCCTACWARDV